MPNTATWVRWAKDAARPYYNSNRQLYLEYGGGILRHLRTPEPDGAGLGTIPELANADHYFFARMFCVIVASHGQGVTALGPGLYSPSLAQITGRIGRGAGMALSSGLMALYVSAWDIFKRAAFAMGASDRVPGDENGRPSAPTRIQMEWGLRGIEDAIEFDYERMDDVVPWGFALDRFNVSIRIPHVPGQMTELPPACY
jgi:hypothetical protein